MSSPQKNANDVVPPMKVGFHDCPTLFAKFSHCLGPFYQLEYVNRHGTYDNCGDYFSDAQSCFMAKVSTNEERKKELFRSSSEYKKSQSKMFNDIFEYKKQPGWDS